MPTKKSQKNYIIDKDFEDTIELVDIIIKDKPIDEATKKLIDDMLKRSYLHMINAYTAQMRFRFWALPMSILTPFLGVTVAILPIVQASSIFYALLGILVTVSGSFHSIFSANFEKCARILIDLNDWTKDFEINLIKILKHDVSLSDDLSLDFIHTKNKEISKIGEEFSIIVIPPISIPLLNKLVSQLSMENKDNR